MSSNNSFASVPYLNQTAHYLIGGNSVTARIVDTPLRIIYSLCTAVNMQYAQTMEATRADPTMSQLLYIMGFFFSKYAISCFLTALLLNRIVISSASRTRNNRITITTGVKALFHISAIIPLVLTLVKLQFRLVHIDDVSTYLFHLFGIFTWSYFIETITAIASNQLPLENTDYTIFELSIQFYNMKGMSLDELLAYGYISDCIVALLSRLLIHLVEVFNIRKRRLIGSSIINIGYLIYLCNGLYEKGISSVSFSIKFRQFPKFFSIVIVVISFICYYMACLVRFNPFDRDSIDLQELKFHSFMTNWINHLNFKGDEDFSTIISKLAMLLCSGTESNDKSLHKEFSNIKIPVGIHSSYAISEYLLQAKDNSVETNDFEDIKACKEFGLLGKVKCCFKAPSIWDKIKGLFIERPCKNGYDKEITAKSQSLCLVECDEDEDDSIDEKCDFSTFYSTYLLQSDNDDGIDNDIADDEYSSDDEYIPQDLDLVDEEINETIDIEDDDDDDLELELMDDTDLESGKEVTIVNFGLLDLVTPVKDINWLISLQSIFNFHLNHAERITRSKYDEFKTHSDKKYCGEEGFDLLCAVCKTNERSVILWPCNCFAICDSCRISLVLRGYDTCICCRSPVHGYSKVE